jgi:hypothetical protein
VLGLHARQPEHMRDDFGHVWLSLFGLLEVHSYGLGAMDILYMNRERSRMFLFHLSRVTRDEMSPPLLRTVYGVGNRSVAAQLTDHDWIPLALAPRCISRYEHVKSPIPLLIPEKCLDITTFRDRSAALRFIGITRSGGMPVSSKAAR